MRKEFLMDHFTAHCLRFVAEVVEPIQLNPHQGSAIRGAFFHALTDSFCMNKPALNSGGCAGCPLVQTCPVAFLVATLNSKADRGRDVPRPYTVQAPLNGKTRYLPGERLEFGLTMFARALNLFPYVILGLQRMERSGLGKRLAENGRRRGTFRLVEVEAYNPLTGERQRVLGRGETLVQVPDVPLTHEQVARTTRTFTDDTEAVPPGVNPHPTTGDVPGATTEGDAPSVPAVPNRLGWHPIISAGGGARSVESVPNPCRALTLEFLTPTRITHQAGLMKQPEFRPLFQRLMERLRALVQAYTDTPLDQALCYRLVGQADRVELVDDQTHWVELESYSTRLRRTTPTSGFVGRATYRAEDWRPFLPWLIWGQFTQVGKDAVKGNGRYWISG
jgi:hypothetical protein